MAKEYRLEPRWLSAPKSRESGTNPGATPRPNPLPEKPRALLSPTGRDPNRGIDSDPNQAPGGPRDGFVDHPTEGVVNDVAAPFRNAEGPPMSPWESRREELAPTVGPQDPRDGSSPAAAEGEAASPSPPERRPYGGNPPAIGPQDPRYKRGF